MKIGELLTKAQKEELRTELEVYLAWLFQVDRSLILVKSEEEIPVEHLSALQMAWKDLKEGRPLAYILGQKEFYGIMLFVDERVLVPRPETEGLLDLVLEYAGQNPLRVLDLGTGSGAIGLALKKTAPQLQVTAADISPEALEVANKNFVQHSAEVNLLQSDLLDSLKDRDFDLLVANLPYIGRKRFNYLSPEVERFEPELALFGGEDGLRLYARLFDQIREGTWSFKRVFGEIGFAQGPALLELAAEKLPGSSCKVSQDLSGLDRYFQIQLS